MNHLHLRIQIIPEIISKSNSCTKFTLQVLHKQSSDTNTLATKNLKIPLKTSPTVGKNGHRLKLLSYNSYRVLFFFPKCIQCTTDCVTRCPIRGGN